MRRPSLKRRHRARRLVADIDEFRRRDQRHIGQRRQALHQAGTNDAVLDDMAERCRRRIVRVAEPGAAPQTVAQTGARQIRVVEMDEQRRIGLGDPDVEDGLRGGRERGPHAERLEHAARAGGDRRDASVESGVEHARRIGAVDQRHAEAGAAERHRQGLADHAAAGDQHIDGEVGDGEVGDGRVRARRIGDDAGGRSAHGSLAHGFF